jgi:filamentous hemagglutinin family protein
MKLPRTIFEFKEYSRKVIACAASASIVLTPAMSFSIPIGGVVAGGQASISDGVGRVDIHQQSDKAVIDWRGFDLSEGEVTEFHQPNNNSLTVNRVNSNNASIINGSLKANGNVMVINPNGMLFGGKANVDVNGLIASTADAPNADLMRNGKLNLNKPGNPNAAIVNLGRIKTKEGGSVGIIAPNISNQGIIEAKLGKVALASGDTATVDLYGDDLINAAVSDKVKSQLIENNGIIAAQGGSIAITAAAGEHIVDSLINLDGVLDAKSVSDKTGSIKVQADGVNAVKGNKTSDKGKKQGASNVYASGIIDASGRGKGERGGKVTVTGDNVALLNGTIIDASGDAGKSGTTLGKEKSAVREGSAGGDIRIGGDYLGLGDTATAKNLYVDAGAYILNDAITSGDAGRSIFWSDGTTQFYGNVFARALGGMGVDATTGSAIAGGKTGDGGFVETSGHKQLDAGGYVDLTSSSGNRGTYFLDPADITIYGYVDPAFVSSDGTSINLAPSLKLWLDASDTSKVNLTYNPLGTTATGTSGSNTITVSANTGLVVGSRIRLGAAGAVTAASTVGADTYTITNIAGTTIALGSNLTTNYNGGAGNNALFQGYVSQLTDKSSAGNNGTQSAAGNMPLWISNGINGFGSALYDNIDDQLTLSSGTWQHVFAATNLTDSTGYDYLFASNIGNDFVIRSYGGVFLGINSNDWAFGNFPTYLVNGSIVANGSPSTGNKLISAASSAPYVGTAEIGGSYVGFSRPLGGYVGGIIAFNSQLNTVSTNLIDQYQSAKWNIALDPIAGAGTEIAEATGATGYSVFSTRYLERLSQTADISLAATNNITLDLKTDTLALTNNRNLTLTAGNQITTASAGTITTTGTGSINFNAANYNQLHALTLNGAGGVNVTADLINLGANLAGTGTLTLQPTSNAQPVNLNNGVAGFALDTTEIGRIQDGWNQINIGRTGSTVTSNMGDTTWNDPVNFRNTVGRSITTLTGAGNASITFTGGWADVLGNITTAGQTIDVSAAGLFLPGTGYLINSNGGNILLNNLNVPGTGNGLTVTSAGGNISLGAIYTSCCGSAVGKTLAFDAGSGNISFTNTISGDYNLNASAANISFPATLSSTAIGNVSLTSTNSLTLPSINAATILARTTGTNSDITIPVGKVLTATGAGNAITLAAGRNVINNAGAGGLSTPSGRWLVFAKDDTNTSGGFTSDFIRYGCPYVTPCTYPVTGNGFLYASNPGSGGGTTGGGTIGLGAAPNPVDPVVILPTINTPVVNTPVAPTNPIQTVIATPAPALPPITLGDKSNVPITVERISIDPTPMITAFAFETSGVSQSFANAMNDLPTSQNESSSESFREVGNGSKEPQSSMDSDSRSMSVWDGMLTFSPELVHSLGLDERTLD